MTNQVIKWCSFQKSEALAKHINSVTTFNFITSFTQTFENHTIFTAFMHLISLLCTYINAFIK